MDINNSFLSFTVPRRLLLTEHLTIGTGHSFNPYSVAFFSSDCTHMVLLRAFRPAAEFLLQVCRFSQRSAQAESANCL